MTSNNDYGVGVYDAERFSLIRHFCFPWRMSVSSIDFIPNCVLLM